MSYWKKAATCAVSVFVGLVVAATPAVAAPYPTTLFGPDRLGPSYGATWARGTITWFDRGVGIDGELRTLSSSGCRALYAYTLDANHVQIAGGVRSTKPKCGDAVHPIEMTVPADERGGAKWVTFCLMDGNAQTLHCSDLYRRPGW